MVLDFNKDCIIWADSCLALYNNQINACTLIGLSAMVYCASKLLEKLCVFWIVMLKQLTTSFYDLYADKPVGMLVEHSKNL